MAPNAAGSSPLKETPKQLVINRTNATALKEMWGPETTAWHGKRVTMFPAPFADPFTGEMGTAIRIKGSPDLTEAKSYTAKIGRKQMQFKLIPTGKANGKKGPEPKTTEPSDADAAGVRVSSIADEVEVVDPLPKRQSFRGSSGCVGALQAEEPWPAANPAAAAGDAARAVKEAEPEVRRPARSAARRRR